MVTWRMRTVMAAVAMLAAACSAGPTAPHAVTRKASHVLTRKASHVLTRKASHVLTRKASHQKGSRSETVTLAFAGDVNFFGRTARLLRSPDTAFGPIASVLRA